MVGYRNGQWSLSGVTAPAVAVALVIAAVAIVIVVVAAPPRQNRNHRHQRQKLENPSHLLLLSGFPSAFDTRLKSNINATSQKTNVKKLHLVPYLSTQKSTPHRPPRTPPDIV
jgi:lipopolysaccharide export LptBFGC system permease protein LptF